MWRHYWVPSLVLIIPLLLAWAKTRFAPVERTEERSFFVTPAGKYTAADIEANGKMTPAEKYRGFQARHDFSPRPGDRLCPITRTKANPACTWVIGGQTYEFCCPPCIDEFVRMACQRPGEIGAPDDYVEGR